jgi:Zn-dependent M32 family carboxypeptidase
MKSKDVPQDDANMMQGKWKDPIYTIDEKGNYTTSYSLGWDVKNTVMQQAWDNINEKVEEIRKRVIDGELSPIAYYMEKNIMDVGLLSKYMGLWKWTVKKHLKQKHFIKLPESTLSKYADIFNMTTDQLKDINLIKSAGEKE